MATDNQGCHHYIGGWPKEYDPHEPNEVNKYMRKLIKEPTFQFTSATKDLVQGAARCIKQNNEIDLFEEYFKDEEPEYMSEPINTKTVMIFKDPQEVKRSVTKIAWHPEVSEHRVGTSYAQLRFQQQPPNMPKESYIWNLVNPNVPETTLDPTSPLCTMSFSTKNTDLLVGGSYNGSLAFFDKRTGTSDGTLKPVQTTILEQSHHDPVYDVFWLASGKSGTETVSTSTDGRILWWDQKMLDKGPTESLNLEQEFTIDGQTKTKILGGTSMEYTADISFKFLVGTEQGYILSASRRKTAEISSRYGIEQGKHYGPIYSIQRNPAHNKYFITVGDWQAKIWCEDLRFHPIMQTRYHQSYLTDGCWSPTRPGLFFLTRMDGFLDVWDFYYRQNEVAYSQKVSDAVLTSISTQGSMAAIGDSNGTVSMMSLCRVLYEADKNEKDLMGAIFERETLREKNLSAAKTLAEKRKDAPAKKENKDKIAEKLQKELDEIEDKFMLTVSEGDEAQLAAIKQRNNMADEPDAGKSGAVAAAAAAAQEEKKE